MLTVHHEREESSDTNAEHGTGNAVDTGLQADNSASDKEYVSTGQEVNLILAFMSQCLKALFRIGMLVRRATPRDRFERALQHSELAFSAQFDKSHIQQNYPKLDSKDSDWLACRLGGANAKRRQFIAYSREHQAKLEAKANDNTMDAITIAQSSKATTFAIPGSSSATEFLHTHLEAANDSVSLVSASTALDRDKKLRLPSLADLAKDGEHFECPICFNLQSFRGEKSWRYVEMHRNFCLADSFVLFPL